MVEQINSQLCQVSKDSFHQVSEYGTSVVCASQQSRCELVNDLRSLFTEQLVSEHELNVSQYSPFYTTLREGKKTSTGLGRNFT